VKKIFSILFALVLVVSLGLATAAPVSADIIDVPGDYDTIQEAIDNAEDGDTIMVAAGEYEAAFVVDGRANISIIGAEGATVTAAASYVYIPSYSLYVWVMAAVEDSENINIEGINFDGTDVSEDAVLGVLYIDSTGSLADLTVENMIGTLGVGAGVVTQIIGAGTSTVEITGCTISNNEIGIVVGNNSTLEAHFNNIVGNSDYGVMSVVMADATHNWWGDVSGPSGDVTDPVTDRVANGTGDAVSVNVHFDPWLEAEVGATKTETVTDGGTVDAKDEADTEVEVTGNATVTVAQYAANPGGSPPTGFGSLGKYIDVYVPDTTEVTEIEIRLYYTDAELSAAGIDDESLLRPLWWDGDEWKECSDNGFNTASTNGYSGYMWAKIRNNTTPSLDDLQGDPFDQGYESGGELPKQGCFIATAAYGTDTAREIDILREFRDEILLPNSLGAELVSLYYRISPPIANFISQHDVLRTAVRVGFVDPIVAILNWSHDLWSVRGS
jgi:hypothetical protein